MVLTIRRLALWADILQFLGLTEFQAIRRLIGGRWERWYVRSLGTWIWHPVTHAFSFGSPKKRPTRECLGFPETEVWP